MCRTQPRAGRRMASARRLAARVCPISSLALTSSSRMARARRRRRCLERGRVRSALSSLVSRLRGKVGYRQTRRRRVDDRGAPRLCAQWWRLRSPNSVSGVPGRTWSRPSGYQCRCRGDDETVPRGRHVDRFDSMACAQFAQLGSDRRRAAIRRPRRDGGDKRLGGCGVTRADPRLPRHFRSRFRRLRSDAAGPRPLVPPSGGPA